MPHRFFKRAPLLVAALALLPAFAVAEPAPAGAGRCAVAARVFLDGLVPDQRKRAVAPFGSEFRRKPGYPPGAAPARTGIRTGELADGQRMRLHDFLGCGLSSQGYQKVLAIIRRGEVARENFAQVPVADRETAAETGSGFYWITVFGEPAPDQPWGWRLEGYHLSLNFTAANGQVSVSPSFLGADPAAMPKGLWAGFRVLDAEFARGLELLESLTPVQRQRAVLSVTLPQGMFTTPDRKDPLTTFEGVPGAAMNESQQQLLWRVIEEYVRSAEPGTAERLLAGIRADGIDKVHFGWMGPVERGKPVYYRVHGPSIQIEFLHGPDAGSPGKAPGINHIHTGWHIPGADFGDDLLAPRSGGSPVPAAGKVGNGS